MDRPLSSAGSRPLRRVRCEAVEGHGLGDEAADPLDGRDQVIVGEVGIAGGGGVAAVSEQAADQRQVLAGHDRVTGHGVAQIVKPHPADAGLGADGVLRCSPFL